MKKFKNPNLLTDLMLYVSMTFNSLLSKIPYFVGFQTKWIMIPFNAVVVFSMFFDVCVILPQWTVSVYESVLVLCLKNLNFPKAERD